MPDYSKVRIRTHTKPNLEQLADGSWQRSWRIRFKETPNLPTIPEALASEIKQEITGFFSAREGAESLKDAIEICLDLAGPREVIAALITKQGHWSGEIVPASWRLLYAVDEMLGTIDTINNYPRDDWLPFSLRSGRTDNDREA